MHFCVFYHLGTIESENVGGPTCVNKMQEQKSLRIRFPIHYRLDFGFIPAWPNCLSHERSG